jgi:hypothetical protein
MCRELSEWIENGDGPLLDDPYESLLGIIRTPKGCLSCEQCFPRLIVALHNRGCSSGRLPFDGSVVLGLGAYLSRTPAAKLPFEFLRTILKKKGSALKEVSLNDHELAVALDTLVGERSTLNLVLDSLSLLLQVDV